VTIRRFVINMIVNSRRGAGAGSHQVDTGLFASAKRQVILRAGHALPDLLTGRLIDPGRKKGIRTWRAVQRRGEELALER
jgi:hypothetical protein